MRKGAWKGRGKVTSLFFPVLHLLHNFLLACFLPREDVDITTSFLLPSYLPRMEGSLAPKFSERIQTTSWGNSENKLDVRLLRTNYLKNSFSYNGATLWNSLPVRLGVRNPSGRSKAQSAKLFEARHSRKQLFNNSVVSYRYSLAVLVFILYKYI